MFKFDDKMARVTKDGSDKDELVAREVITECMAWLFESRLSGSNRDSNEVADRMISSMRKHCKDHEVDYNDFTSKHAQRVTEHLKWISEKGWSKYVLASMASANKEKRRIISIEKVFGGGGNRDLRNDEIEAVNMHNGTILSPRKFYEA